MCFVKFLCIFLLLFGVVWCEKVGSFSILDQVDSSDEAHRRVVREPIQYVSETVRNRSIASVRNGALNIISIRNFRTIYEKATEFNIQVSSRGNESYVREFVKHVFSDFSTDKIVVYRDLAIIQNLSLPFKFNGVEYYFGTNWDMSNYSSIPHSLICEYPMARYSPSLYGRLFSFMPSHRISRIFFGCESTKYTYCCGLECCENIEITEIMKTFLYFIGVLIFLILICQQISSCDKHAERKRRLQAVMQSIR